MFAFRRAGIGRKEIDLAFAVDVGLAEKRRLGIPTGDVGVDEEVARGVEGGGDGGVGVLADVGEDDAPLGGGEGEEVVD